MTLSEGAGQAGAGLADTGNDEGQGGAGELLMAGSGVKIGGNDQQGNAGKTNFLIELRHLRPLAGLSQAPPVVPWIEFNLSPRFNFWRGNSLEEGIFERAQLECIALDYHCVTLVIWDRTELGKTLKGSLSFFISKTVATLRKLNFIHMLRILLQAMMKPMTGNFRKAWPIKMTVHS